MAIVTINPATGTVLGRFVELGDDEIDARLQGAIEAFQSYRRTSLAGRAQKLQRAAEILENECDEFGRMMTAEMGKLRAAGVEEALKCARACRYYAENAASFIADEPIETDAAKSYVAYQPLGAILAVMPWNFPFWQVFRFAAPALMAGNVGLLKHASNVPRCALAIEDVFRRAGFPVGVFQTLLVGSSKVAGIVADARVAAVTLTGSEHAGRQVASVAGREIKKTVLELGGSDPFIVMPSADLDEAVRTAVKARMINNGQSCIAAKRFILHEAIADRFEREFVERMGSLRVGDPMEAGTDVGPLATKEILEGLQEQVRQTVALGARVLAGGTRVERPGYYYAPTVLADVPRGSPAYSEELFGPVAALFRVRDLDAAVEIANGTEFGLGASAWTNDVKEQNLLIERIESGQVFINAMVASDPRLPFGGVKRSGYGRELGAFGIREFMNAKSVSIRRRGTEC